MEYLGDIWRSVKIMPKSLPNKLTILQWRWQNCNSQHDKNDTNNFKIHFRLFFKDYTLLDEHKNLFTFFFSKNVQKLVCLKTSAKLIKSLFDFVARLFEVFVQACIISVFHPCRNRYKRTIYGLQLLLLKHL